ncbi:MAG: hypothetical protein CSA36_00505, partial [Draconibacterium sp.]
MKRFFIKTLAIGGLLFFIHSASYCQLKGISYTFSPSIEYIFHHQNSALRNGPAYGGKLGFGFGEYIQLNATYVKSINGKTDFAHYASALSGLTNKEISLTRIGGEFKASLSKKGLAPFLTLGTGVQTLSTNTTDKNDQIYLSSGLGINFRLDSRINLSLEALNTSYRLNPVNTLLNPTERQNVPADYTPKSNIVSDISAKARLSFFLGGKRPGKLSNLDKAYLEQFSGGFKGLSVPIEPTVMRIDFSDKLPFNDAWFAGVSAGFDFGPYIGIRGYYMRGLEDDSFKKFDNISVWGGETKFKLNYSEGIVPYLTLGGGKINIQDGYMAKNGLTPENKVFASGGLGLEIPLARGLKVSGFVNGLLTTVGNEKDLSKPEDLVTSISYGAKLGFVIGKKPQSAQTILNSKLSDARNNIASEKDQEMNALAVEYEQLLQKKEEEIAQKEKELQQKQYLLDSLALGINYNDSVVVTNVEKNSVAPTTLPVLERKQMQNSIIIITPQELIDIIREIKAAPGIAPQHYNPSGVPPVESMQPIETDIEKGTNEESASDTTKVNSEENDTPTDSTEITDQKTNELVDSLTYKVNTISMNMAAIEQKIDSLAKSPAVMDTKSLEDATPPEETYSQDAKQNRRTQYVGLSVLGGVNVGEKSFFNLGLRWKHQLSDS